jgi:hypothetical protein
MLYIHTHYYCERALEARVSITVTLVTTSDICYADAPRSLTNASLVLGLIDLDLLSVY